MEKYDRQVTVRTAVRTVATVRNPSTAGGTSGTKSNSTATGSKIRTVNEQLNEKFAKFELIELVNHWRDVQSSSQMKFTESGEGTALRVLFPKEMNVESGYFLEEPERIEQL